MGEPLSAMSASVRETYISALLTLAVAFTDYRVMAGSDPILVGGSAVCVYTAGQFLSGDFDFIAGNDSVLSECMERRGFVTEHRQGRLRIGWYHPAHPAFGFQQVTGPLFDGRPTRTVSIRIRGEIAIVLPSVEDMIADRLAQHAVASPTDTTRLEQASAMLALVPFVDEAYLLRRVADEGGDATLLGLDATRSNEKDA